MNSLTPTKVFIVDDHPVVRAGLKELLASDQDILVVGEADDVGDVAMQAIRNAGPQLVIADIKLKSGNGIDLCCDLKAAFPEIYVLLLSAFWDNSLINQALAAGADGYLLKNAEQFDLSRSISALLRGERYFDPAISAALIEQLRPVQSLPALDREESGLVDLVAEGLTNKEIAARLHLSQYTVRDRLSALMARFSVRSRAGLAGFATKQGRN